MKIKTFALLFLIAGYSFGQETISENYSFRFVTAKKVSKSKIIEGNTSGYSISVPKDQKKIQVRYKMKSVSGKKEDFDPNKFYLVSDEYKVRLRPIDVKHNYAVGMIYIGFQHLVNFKPRNRRVKEWVKFKPNVKDTYWDYEIDGYQDISHSINYGTKRKPQKVSPYLDHKELKSCRIDVYFSVPKEFEKGKIYYGEKMIKDFEL